MLTAQECAQAAETLISSYCIVCGCETPQDVKNAGEMLISKMARGVEKVAGNEAATEVLNRTIFHVAMPKGGVS